MTALHDLHILIVDDNQQMRYLLRCILRAGGLTRVSEAETAPDALQVMQSSPVDLIILDWKMAPIDGLAFTRMIRLSSESPNPYAPILMLTAHTEISRVAAARDAGVCGFVRKPISSRLLFDRISLALTDQRLFIRTDTFFGPDRRRGVPNDYAGPFRRETDFARAPSLETIDLDEARWCA